ncbi:Cof-type HAD-IIB family hydrolase [Vibrio sp.]|nr:Cof-type HAD-IIB family hydrolase [Vibrio sp.]
MEPSRKLLASDYDKTFFYKTAQDKLPANLEAVAQWQSENNLFVISTGRDAASMLHERKTRHLSFDYLVSLNGSFIIDRHENVLFKAAIPTHIAAELVSDLRIEFNDELIVSNGFDGCNLTNKEKSKTDSVAKEIFQRNSTIYSRSIEESLNYDVFLIGCLTQNQEQATAVKKRIMDKFGRDLDVFINLNYINVVPKGISKASGVNTILSHEEISKNDVVSIGDDLNDIPMIEEFNGYAVPNARPELIDAAQQTVDSVAELIKMKLQ